MTIARRAVTACATRLNFGDVERTKLVTAASELGRNVLVHGAGGTMTISELQRAGRTGIELCFADQGPGIPDIGRAMQDGFTTARSLGLGLGGARRLVNEFEIVSEPGMGTKVTVIQWKRR
ncbi:anti-sigma regulatory factor [Caenimonas sedimenti]|uniref:Anti-sigma regulatory factor n=1 Tax=Caenimonas sedimenti TaxID=2596921 RepID=A0A562ZP53_9BURK|nr:anti-sigma regulatory factor [Caenimonas sedimenti]